MVRLLAGPCILFTSCRKAVIPPNVSIDNDICTAAHRNAIRYPIANPKLSTRLLKTLNTVLFTTFRLNSLCVFSSLPTASSYPSSVFSSTLCCTVSCNTLCTFESLSLTFLVSSLIFPTYVLLTSTKSGIMKVMTSARRQSMEARYVKAPMNMSNTDIDDGIVSVRKDTTLLTSASNLFSTSPECLLSLPCHSERSILSSIICCILFCAFIPSKFLTQMPDMLSAKSASMRSPIMATAV